MRRVKREEKKDRGKDNILIEVDTETHQTIWGALWESSMI